MSPNSNATNRSHHPMTHMNITREQYDNAIREAQVRILRDLAEDESAFYLSTWLRDRACELEAK